MNLKQMTKRELYELAKKFGIKNRSKMLKAELLQALTDYQDIVSPSASPQEETVSSGLPVSDDKEYPEKPEYPIPERYNIDTVVLLPVNPKKEFVYWEVSDETSDRYKRELTLTTIAFILKIFSGDSENKIELASIKVDQIGDWYFDLYCPDQNLWAEIGILDNKGNYHPIKSSKKIKMPSDSVCEEIDKETWMTVGKNIEKIFHLSGADDMKSIEGISSAKLHSELFKKLHSTDSLSSSTLHKKGDK